MDKKKPPSRELPKSPWEVKYNVNEPSKCMKRDGGSAFNPRSAKDREYVHSKINEQDY